MANFMCQPDWTVGCPGMQPTTKQINTHTHYAIICIWLAHTITETLTYINICTHTSLSSVSLQNPNIVCMLFWYINSANVFKSIIESITEAGKNTWVGCLSLLQRIFLIQGSNPGLLHCRQILYHLSHQGSPVTYYSWRSRGPKLRPGAAKHINIILKINKYKKKCIKMPQILPGRQ